MKLKIAVLILISAGVTFSRAEGPAAAEGQGAARIDPELAAKAENVASLLNVIMVDLDTDSLAELQKKMRTLKAVQKEMGEENLLRLEMIEEFRRTQFGIQALTVTQAGGGGKKENLAALERMEKSLSTPANETEGSRAAKARLAEFRAALAAFRADHGSLFPEDPAELVGKYLPRIPEITLPGHRTATSSVKILKGVKSKEELFQKIDDAGNWLYVGDRTSPIRGTLLFNCSHRDYNGSAMYKY